MIITPRPVKGDSGMPAISGSRRTILKRIGRESSDILTDGSVDDGQSLIERPPWTFGHHLGDLYLKGDVGIRLDLLCRIPGSEGEAAYNCLIFNYRLGMQDFAVHKGPGRPNSDLALGGIRAGSMKRSVPVFPGKPVKDAETVQFLALSVVRLYAFEHGPVLIGQVLEPVEVSLPPWPKLGV